MVSDFAKVGKVGREVGIEHTQLDSRACCLGTVCVCQVMRLTWHGAGWWAKKESDKGKSSGEDKLRRPDYRLTKEMAIREVRGELRLNTQINKTSPVEKVILRLWWWWSIKDWIREVTAGDGVGRSKDRPKNTRIFLFFKKRSELFALSSILYGDQRSNTESGLHGLGAMGFYQTIKTP